MVVGKEGGKRHLKTASTERQRERDLYKVGEMAGGWILESNI